MPISGPASYLPTADEFIAHWTSANAALGAAGPILLLGGSAVATLNALRDTLADQRAAVEVSRNEVEATRADIEALKAALLARLNQFNTKLQSLAPDSRWTAMCPHAFSVSEGIGKVLPPLDDLADVWDRYEDASGPFTLLGGYALVDFTADLDLLKGHYTAHTAARNGLDLARSRRTETEEKIHPLLKAYRQRIPGEFPPGSAILETLPRLSPLPGHTPPAPVLNGTLDPVTGTATLGWDASTDPAVISYQLRATAGPEYEPDDDTILGDFPASGPLTWTGSFGPGLPGTATSYKVFALTADDNEKGSNALTLTLPV